MSTAVTAVTATEHAESEWTRMSAFNECLNIQEFSLTKDQIRYFLVRQILWEEYEMDPKQSKLPYFNLKESGIGYTPDNTYLSTIDQ